VRREDRSGERSEGGGWGVQRGASRAGTSRASHGGSERGNSTEVNRMREAEERRVSKGKQGEPQKLPSDGHLSTLASADYA
jgi:hypothetical protein